MRINIQIVGKNPSPKARAIPPLGDSRGIHNRFPIGRNLDAVRVEEVVIVYTHALKKKKEKREKKKETKNKFFDTLFPA